jgi:hypothetical protein
LRPKVFVSVRNFHGAILKPRDVPHRSSA